tara:strand:+ start:252 stop:875 length:624 start_codon:yes stop_codon:yes gene_type:complete
VKIAVLISGRGSNLQALIESSKTIDSSFKVVQVISNNPNALGLEFSKNAGIPYKVIDHLNFKDRESFDTVITKVIESSGAELVCLAGFMRILSSTFIDHWRDRMVNIHPSKLPAFKGLDVHQRVIDSGEKFTGCTVHFVRNEMDTGPIICQSTIPVHKNDDKNTLASRVLKKEHQIYPQAINLLAKGRVTLIEEQVLIDGEIIHPNK